MKVKKQDLEINNLVVIKAPNKLTNGGVTVFLAGSIEMGKAVDWQTQIENELKEMTKSIKMKSKKTKNQKEKRFFSAKDY